MALVGPLGVRGLALSLSIAYSAAALLAMAVIRRRVGGLGGDDLTVPVRRVLAASAVMAVTTVLAVNVSGAPSGVGLLARVVLAVVVGAGHLRGHRRGAGRAPPSAVPRSTGVDGPPVGTAMEMWSDPSDRRTARPTSSSVADSTISPAGSLPVTCDR